MKLLVGTPAYNCLVNTDYLHTILALERIKVPFELITIGNESLITRARNKILSFFQANKEFSHLLFLDADIGIKADDIKKLLLWEKDVIGAAVPLKGYQDNKLVFNFGKILDRNMPLIEVDRIGCAVMMLSRKAVQALVDAADQYDAGAISRGTQLHIHMYDVFKVGVIDGEYLSEDYWVCKTLRDKGFSIYVDASIRTKHSGMFSFGGW